MRRDTTPPVVAVGELQSLLEDWRRHLRAKNRSPATIDSQLIVGRAFADYLTQHGMSTDVGVIGSEHSPSLEHPIPGASVRAPPRHLGSLSIGLVLAEGGVG
jgi:hypothetical protein